MCINSSNNFFLAHSFSYTQVLSEKKKENNLFCVFLLFPLSQRRSDAAGYSMQCRWRGLASGRFSNCGTFCLNRWSSHIQWGECEMAIWQTWQHTQDYTYRYCNTAGHFTFSHYISSSLYTIVITYLHIVEELLRASCPKRCWYDLGKSKDLQNLSQLLVFPGGAWRLPVTVFSRSAGRVTGPQVCIRGNFLCFSPS